MKVVSSTILSVFAILIIVCNTDGSEDMHGKPCTSNDGRDGKCNKHDCPWRSEYLLGSNCGGMACCMIDKSGLPCTSSDGRKGTCTTGECTFEYLEGSRCNGMYCCLTVLRRR